MLGKLMKHEFRATARIMLTVMGALAALAVLANLSLRTLTKDVNDDITVLKMILILIVVFFGIGVVVTAVMAIVLMVSRFYRNLLKDEGYLMFTLPVSTHELVWSKIIVSTVWFLAAGLLIFLVMSLTGLNLSATNLEMILEDLPSWAEITQYMDENGIRGQVSMLIFQGFLSMLLWSVVTCLHFYAAMALGHMFSKSKILLSVVFFIGISFAFNLMEMGYGVFVLYIFGPKLNEAVKMVEELSVMSGMIWHAILLCAIQGAVLYVATVLGLKRGLNLE